MLMLLERKRCTKRLCFNNYFNTNKSNETVLFFKFISDAVRNIKLCLFNKLIQECKWEKMWLWHLKTGANECSFVCMIYYSPPVWLQQIQHTQICLLHTLSPSLLLPLLLPHSHTPSLQFWGQLGAHLSTWSHPFFTLCICLSSPVNRIQIEGGINGLFE